LSLRDTLLEAADALLDERPWAKISMGEVASRASVSRQTLYNEFGGRKEFAQALLIREAERLLAGPERAIAAHADDPRAAITGALRTFLEEAAHNRLVESMTSQPDDGLLALVTTEGAVVAAAGERLAAHIEGIWVGVDPQAIRRMTETVVRLGISHAALPSGSPAQTARAIAEVIGPHLDELVLSRRSQAA
jgi:AcrR family transcriptional regulator